MKKYIKCLFFLLILYPEKHVSSADIYEMGFEKRSDLLIEQIADHYNPPSMNIGDPEKYYWPKVIARFVQYGLQDSIGNEIIELLKDNSPFHFTLVGMARIIYLFENAPAIKKNEIKIIKNVFERNDSYNAWTCEGTENHVNMSRTSGYLYAQKALTYADVFKSAKYRHDQMENWIKSWSGMIYKYGTGEWNSGIYGAYNVIGWLNVYDFAKDRKVKKMAKAVLDYYAAELAMHYSWGTMGGSEMRGNGAAGTNKTATNYLSWLWFYNDSLPLPSGFTGSGYIQSVHAATSTYRPPQQMVKLARKENIATASYYRNSKPEYLFHEGSFVKQFFFIDDHFTLGSCTSPYGGWTGTTYQMVNWKLVSGKNKGLIPAEVTGNGLFYDEWSGKSCNPFTQIFQHKNVIMQLTFTPENAMDIYHEVIETVEEWKELWKRDFFKRFPHEDHKGVNLPVVNYNRNVLNRNAGFLNLPQSINWISRTNKYLVDLGSCFLCIYYLNPQNTGAFISKEKKKYQERLFLIDEAEHGHLCGFIIEIIKKKKNSSLETLIKTTTEKSHLDRTKIESERQITYVTTKGDTIVMQYQTNGTFSEATVDWGYGPEEQQIMMKSPPFKQPEWPTGEGYGRLPIVWVNGKRIDWKEKWPVYSGPEMKLKNQILEIDTNRDMYKVDYNGEIPVFTDH